MTAGEGDYQLLDFGGGRRLERFGPCVLDRPCPAAEATPMANPGVWTTADARFERTAAESGAWHTSGALPPRWTVTLGRLQFELKRAPFGHVGVFPEQLENWGWLFARLAHVLPAAAAEIGVRRDSDAPPAEEAASLRLLNLFAYTGGSTFAAATGGAEVTHVDAARNVVAWARRNAERCGLADAAVRWVTEDATKYCKRELRRGARYHGVILDPPSYGHGPRGEVWRLARDLPRLLELCAQLTQPRPRLILLTCHTPEFGPRRLATIAAEAFQLPLESFHAGAMSLTAVDGRRLPSGTFARFADDPRD